MAAQQAPLESYSFQLYIPTLLVVSLPITIDRNPFVESKKIKKIDLNTPTTKDSTNQQWAS